MARAEQTPIETFRCHDACKALCAPHVQLCAAVRAFARCMGKEEVYPAAEQEVSPSQQRTSWIDAVAERHESAPELRPGRQRLHQCRRNTVGCVGAMDLVVTLPPF